VGLDRFPFTSYDFWAYLAAGFLLLGPADFVFGTNLLSSDKDWSWFQIGVAVSSAYVAGQLIASLSATVLERGLVGKVLGYPRNILFGKTKTWGWVRWCLSGYYTALPEATQRAAMEKGKAVGVDAPGESLFWPAFNAARERPKVMERLESFLNQYGFARNIATVAFLDALLFAWSYKFHDGPPLHGNLGWLALVVAVGMTLRYLKFYRLYANEVFTAYAYAKESK
jgi:hypothetical protein